MVIQPGLRIQGAGSIGALGLIVNRISRPNETYLLSCYHVLDGGYSEGVVTLPDHGNRVIAHYQRSNDTAIKGMDVAIAKITINANDTLSNTTLDNRYTIVEAGYWRIGGQMTLSKYGPATQRTRCTVKEDQTHYSNLDEAIVLAKHPNGRIRFCDKGDSGSIWCNAITGKGVAIHARGGLSGNLAAASPLIWALEDLNLEIHH